MFSFFLTIGLSGLSAWRIYREALEKKSDRHQRRRDPKGGGEVPDLFGAARWVMGSWVFCFSIYNALAYDDQENKHIQKLCIKRRVVCTSR